MGAFPGSLPGVGSGYGFAGGYLGGMGFGLPVPIASIAAPTPDDKKVKADDPMPRDWQNPQLAWGAWGGSLPGFDKAPPLTVPILWQMRRYCVIVLAQAITTGPILASPRTIEIHEAYKKDPEAQKLQEWATKYYLPLVEKAMAPGFESLNFGWWLQELIWDRKDGYTLPVDVNTILPGEAQLYRDVYRKFAGFQIGTQYRDSRYALLTVNNPHIDPIFGESRNAYCREEWWRARQSEDICDKTERKAAGRQMLVQSPQGWVPSVTLANGQTVSVPVPTFVQNLLNAAVTNDVIHVPSMFFDKATIEKNPDLAEIPVVKIQQLDWGDIGAAVSAHIARMTGLQADIMMARMRPTREAMEGSNGTKAEAGTHGQIGVTDSELVAENQLKQIDAQVLNRAIVTNFGPDAVGKIYTKQAPLSDPQQDFLQKTATAMAAGPGANPKFQSNIDERALAIRVELPVVDEEEAAQKLAEAEQKKQAEADARNKALVAGKQNGQSGSGKPPGGSGANGNDNGRMQLSASVAERLAGYLDLDDEYESALALGGEGNPNHDELGRFSTGVSTKVSSVAHAESILRDMGVQTVSLPKSLHLAQMAVDGVSKLKEAGRSIPKSVTSSKFENAKAVAYGSHNGIALTTRKFDPSLLEKSEKSGWLSSPNVILHEAGHIEHQASTGQMYDTYSTWSYPDHQKPIALQVSRYAGLNPKEFVAEVFAGHLHGKTYSPEVMAMYSRFGGPKL